MIELRKSENRGRSRNDWLDSRHTFSFGHYHDPEQMGVSLLRVINDDRVGPAAGFASHPHRNMEIVSYILEGELEHRDSMGNGGVIRRGEVQRISAGSGVTHSEFNPSSTNDTHFLQIWLLPDKRGIEPDYAQQYFSPKGRQGQLRLLVSSDGAEGSIAASTDALLFGTLLGDRQQVTYEIKSGRVVYVHVARGKINLNETQLAGGDGASVSEESLARIEGCDDAEVLLFDLPTTIPKA